MLYVVLGFDVLAIVISHSPAASDWGSMCAVVIGLKQPPRSTLSAGVLRSVYYIGMCEESSCARKVLVRGKFCCPRGIRPCADKEVTPSLLRIAKGAADPCQESG
jgi:hypothetical protein